jgi:hypothetical protein
MGLTHQRGNPVSFRAFRLLFAILFTNPRRGQPPA